VVGGRLAAALGAVGLVLIVVGTFLPWLHSGRATHNSYQADGAGQRLLAVSGPTHTLLAAWPFVGLICALVVVLFGLGWAGWAAAAGAVVAIGTAAVAVGALTVRRTTFAAPAALGPGITLSGGIVVVIAATLMLFRRGRPRP
jgi:uncharacterized membrane protein YjjP (DUF1212 family)